MKIKQFIKDNKIKIIVGGTIVGGAVIGGVMGVKFSGFKFSGFKPFENKDVISTTTKMNTKEIIDYILNVSDDNKFAIFKESDKYIIVDL